MDGATSGTRCAACLRPVLQAHEVAALLRADRRALLKRVRAGHVPEATRSFDRIGYIFDARDVERMIETRWPDAADRDRAFRGLLGLRAGSLRALEGQLVPVVHHAWDERAPRYCPADTFADDELRELVVAAGSLAATPATFDAWAVTHADGITHLDLIIRLSAASWEQLLPGPASEPADLDAPALDDPVVALREAAVFFGGPPSYGRFDAWAEQAGCPLRAGGIRRQFNGWTAALRAAGLVD